MQNLYRDLVTGQQRGDPGSTETSETVLVGDPQMIDSSPS
jgi:hypothetical protein